MAKYNDEQKLKVFGLLKAGESAKDIARTESIPYPTILKWRRELEEVETKEDLAEIIDVEPEIVHEVAEGVKERLEMIAHDAGDLVDEVVTSVDKLMTLQTDMQEAGISVVAKIEELLIGVTNPNELKLLVESLSELQNAFFGKVPNVNVLNAPGAQFSDSRVSKWKDLNRPV